jgi:DNA-binding NarL/FixJ family response regulator
MADIINLAILEDHQATIDGYIHRLSDNPNIKIAGTCLFSQCMKELLKDRLVDMLILDINVPISEENRNIQPIHQFLAELKIQLPRPDDPGHLHALPTGHDQEHPRVRDQRLHPEG